MTERFRQAFVMLKGAWLAYRASLASGQRRQAHHIYWTKVVPLDGQVRDARREMEGW